MLEKDPQELFAAIKDASGIANYLMEKGEFLQNITEEKRQIRHIEAENIDQEIRFLRQRSRRPPLCWLHLPKCHRLGKRGQTFAVQRLQILRLRYTECAGQIRLYPCSLLFLLMPPSGSRSAERASTFPPT